jgi:hypothetical protein
VYEGNFENGFQHGLGKYRAINGSVYIGEFKEHAMSGFGKMTFKNGDIFEGGTARINIVELG